MKKTLSILVLSASLLSAERAIGLGEAYEMALQHDEQLKSIAFESMAASERVWQATALLLPSLELSYMYNGERYDKAYEGREKYKLNESFQRYGITLRQQVFRPDLWISRSQEGLREQGYKITHESTRQELASRVAKAYFDLAFANKNLELASSYEEANKAKSDQMQKQLQMGLANKMDALEAKVRYDQAK
ncbi:MAG: TolC family protein, partial [Campylobacter sp.]|nr:TolC family protein [Campylobacter sp.]